MKWIKKYWLAILLYLAFGINVFLIQPGQRRFYLDDELERIDKISWHFSLIVASILFALLLIYLLFTKLSGIGTWGAGMVGLLFWLIGPIIFFEPSVETTILLTNRIPKHEYRTKFIVDSLAGDTVHKDLFLWDPVIKQPLSARERNSLISADQFDRLHFGDSFDVTFSHGLFGIDYVCQ